MMGMPGYPFGDEARQPPTPLADSASDALRSVLLADTRIAASSFGASIMMS